MLVVYCHFMTPLVVNSILIKAGFNLNYTEEFFLIVQWISALIAEICFITCVMLQQKIKQFLHDFSSFIESQDRIKGGESSSQFRWFAIAKIKV